MHGNSFLADEFFIIMAPPNRTASWCMWVGHNLSCTPEGDFIDLHCLWSISGRSTISCDREERNRDTHVDIIHTVTLRESLGTMLPHRYSDITTSKWFCDIPVDMSA